MKSKLNTKALVLIGMFAAIISIVSPWSIVIGPVPVTLQTFAIALAGYTLGSIYGFSSVIIYILLGCVGLPVFSKFGAGPGVITGVTGGFIIGFPIMAFLSGFRNLGSSNIMWKKVCGLILGIVGLLIVDLIGLIQFHALTEYTYRESLMFTFVPFIIKDLISVAAALFIGSEIRKRLVKAKIM